ncbi:ATP synthase F1 subunit gamma [Candidatus Palauibacter sp.]|uniref:ATP synthase F1 subunit gamma n=1 Tax=Candidatus Palauibacter sp. TaxID=3101350 RepID=UPI003B020718
MSKSRDIYRRMKSVDSTKKITRTMEMVATAKLAQAQGRVIRARPYSAQLIEMIARLATPDLAESQPLLRQPARIRRAAVVLVTSNRGLCGAFNANLIRTAQAQLRELEAVGAAVEFHVYGNKGISYFRFRGVEMALTRNDLGDPPATDDARTVIDDLAARFVAGDLDAVRLVFAEFRNMVSTPPSVRQILPVGVGEARKGPQPYYILDPSEEGILNHLLPLYVTNSTYSALLETSAAEQAARRTAMKSATDNAEDFLDNLRRTYNRARQAEITNQIAEIIGGADALEG